MTDKVQKIREEIKMVVNRRLNLLNGDYFDLNKEVDGFTNEIMDIIDSLQEEPVSEFPNAESMIESYKQRLISQANGLRSPLIDMCLASYKHGINETLDTLNLSNTQRTVKNLKESASEDLEEAAKNHAVERYRVTRDRELAEKCKWSFKAGAQWQKEKDSTLPKIWPRETLDEYAYQVAYDMSHDWMKEEATWDDVQIAVKLGAQWQKENGKKEESV